MSLAMTLALLICVLMVGFCVCRKVRRTNFRDIPQISQVLLAMGVDKFPGFTLQFTIHEAQYDAKVSSILKIPAGQEEMQTKESVRRKATRGKLHQSGQPS